ncbi:MAG: fatty acid hydroxylase family protein [Wenzhouxiangellaceae bacterium]|nr:fatty acid hydroxylase family protein [Wenzhouxiangellaceae bacterium]
MTSEKTARYREHYRQQLIPDGYSGPRHFAFILGFVGMVIALGLIWLEDVRALEWLAVPATFLYANLAEYLGHRFVMHRRRPGLASIHERHTLQHHRFFTHEAMQFDSTDDFRAVLFPPLLTLFFIAAFALPAGALLTWLFSANVAWLFVVTAVAYYGSYEVLHFAYHQADGSKILALPGVRRMRRLHHRHHDPSIMAHANFNITWPICDALFGSRVTDDRSDDRSDDAADDRLPERTDV